LIFNTPGTSKVLRDNEGQESSPSFTPDPVLEGKYSYFDP
jgi:hypothetical protein